MLLVQDAAFLISKGHRESEIGDYPFDKFFLYVKAARQNEAAERARQMVDMVNAIAMAFGSKEAGDAHKKLQEAAEPKG